VELITVGQQVCLHVCLPTIEWDPWELVSGSDSWGYPPCPTQCLWWKRRRWVLYIFVFFPCSWC
jgi:hypothetical protein